MADIAARRAKVLIRCEACGEWFDRLADDKSLHVPICRTAGLKRKASKARAARLTSGQSLPLLPSPPHRIAVTVRSVAKDDALYEGTTRTQEPRLRLRTHQGSRIEGLHRCAECGITKKGAWRFRHSNRGEVTVCITCMDVLKDRSFGPADVFNRSVRG